MTDRELHVVFGAGGGAGSAVVRALIGAGRPVRAVTRGGTSPVPAGVEQVRADALDPAAVRRACADATTVYHCINTPYPTWPATLPRILDALVDGAAAADATLVYCDNLYLYGPVREPMTERTTPRATGTKGQLRVQLAESLFSAHERGRVRATSGRASDFFGPAATNTIAGQLVFPAVLAGRRARWLGSLDEPHSLNYIEDVGRQLVTLGTDERALGSVWHLPACPPVTGREFIRMAFQAAGKPPKLGVYPRWMIRMAGLASPLMRELVEVLYQFERPFLLDAGRFTEVFGDPGVTPLPEAIATSLEWHRAHAAGG